jgi:DNA-binding NarL/FixJ family response regulator
MTLKIMLVDDHAVVRQGLKQILVEAFNDGIFGEAQNAAEALSLARQQVWDIMVLDLTLPGESGLDVLKQIRHDYPQLPVLILSMHPENQYAVRTIKAGAAGYLTKESAPEELVQAIRKIQSGGKYISDSVAEKLAIHVVADDDKPPHERLSDREYQIMCMIASGKEVKQIADELSLSVKTVSTYRTRLLEKMSMQTNAELTYYAISNQLV